MSYTFFVGYIRTILQGLRGFKLYYSTSFCLMVSSTINFVFVGYATNMSGKIPTNLRGVLSEVPERPSCS